MRITIILYTVGHVYRDDKEIRLTTLHKRMFSIANSPPTLTNILEEIYSSAAKSNKTTTQAPCENKRYQVKILKHTADYGSSPNLYNGYTHKLKFVTLFLKLCRLKLQ